VRLNPNVILATGERTTPALLAATTVIPIVQPTLTDPVERGYAKSLARPGGNITGISLHVDREIYGKMIELLKEAAPRISRVAVLHRASQRRELALHSPRSNRAGSGPFARRAPLCRRGSRG
jgi:putative ABC transport system substrate-binding protein